MGRVGLATACVEYCGLGIAALACWWRPLIAQVLTVALCLQPQEVECIGFVTAGKLHLLGAHGGQYYTGHCQAVSISGCEYAQ